jgi:hypothetical protein
LVWVNSFLRFVLYHWNMFCRCISSSWRATNLLPYMKTCKSFKSGKSCAVLVITLLLHITFIQIRLTYDGHGYYTIQDESGVIELGFRVGWMMVLSVKR